MFEDEARHVEFDPPALDLPLLAEHLQLLRFIGAWKQVGVFYLQSEDDNLFVADFEIRPASRGVGFGTAAIAKLAELARAAGFKKLTGRIEGTVSENVDKLVRWYSERGFTVERLGSRASICINLVALDSEKPVVYMLRQ